MLPVSLPTMSESPSDRLPARNAVGVLLFIACCLLSSFRLTHTSPNPLHLSTDGIAQRAERRFSPLRSQLPARGVIGYVGESGNAGTEDYYLAQYSLAPLIIERSPDHRVVIASFPNSQVAIPGNLQLVKDFGNRVLLFSNKDAR